jgi:TolB-like protein/predicted Ser/Thr protein kinase
VRESVSHYRILRKLGEGGMGVVYAAEDVRLGRSVALKMVRAELAGAESRERLRREARAAATISHPNICQLYEVGEDEGELFIAMELLEGEPLFDRIARGAVPLKESLRIAFEVLAALSALHRRGVLHRDLKPSNIFLTEHGAKLLDFGVARTTVEEQRTILSLTATGGAVGTLQYMAPEQAAGENVDARADLFAMGAILYEMLSGKPPFVGETAVRQLHAVLYEQPAMLTGSPAIAAVDRIVHRALAKQPSARFLSAEHFAAELRTASGDTASVDAPPARPISRLIVLPLRLLRPDPDVDFLSFSLADAVTNALSGLGSLVVRSSLTAAKLGADADLQKAARDADVDVVLSGTLLRAGDQLRLTAQLAEAPSGAIVWSQVMQVSFGDIFQLQDTLVQKLIEALAIPLTAREHRMLGRDVPATAKAYEFYLRANEVAKEPAGWDLAVDLYKQCLDQDPDYAPAWARLGYVYRMIGKYRDADSETNRAHAVEALDRALAINPDLPIAHKVTAQIEVEVGRGIESLTRLLRQARQVADAELYAALCHVCRYCGLLDASIAAHQQAVRLDPKVTTSVIHTWFVMKKFQRIIDAGMQSAPYIGALALSELGRRDEAIALLGVLESKLPPRLRAFWSMSLHLAEGRRPDNMDMMRALVDTFGDPEGLYYTAQTLARFGEIDTAVKGMTRAVDLGYYSYPAFATDPWLDPLRGDARFQAALARARERHEAAVAAFKSADGERILGVTVPRSSFE